jgi:hypothetical protein
LTRTLRIALGLAVLFSWGLPAARAQNGAFLCSAGTRDGLDCASDDECPGGVCVLAQGVCNDTDGFACACPAGTCGGTPVCSDDASFGTCSGGAFAGECCDQDFNCDAGTGCVGSQKVCVGGQSQGLPCLRNEHCVGGTCRSTGRFCLGTCQSGSSAGDLCTSSDDCGGAECFSDFQDAACDQDADCCVAGTTCPAGICEGAAENTPTPTRTRTTTTPRATSTPTQSGGVTTTPQATNTPEPTAPTPPTATEAPVATPTGKPEPGTSVVAQASTQGATTLTVKDATSFPATGTVEIVVDPNDPKSVMRVGYSKSNLSNTLFLDAPLPRNVPTGALVRSSSAPALRYDNVGEGAGCMITPRAGSDGVPMWLAVLGVLVALSRRRSR